MYYMYACWTLGLNLPLNKQSTVHVHALLEQKNTYNDYESKLMIMHSSTVLYGYDYMFRTRILVSTQRKQNNVGLESILLAHTTRKNSQ